MRNLTENTPLNLLAGALHSEGFGVKPIEKMDVENVMKQGEIKKAQKRSLKK